MALLRLSTGVSSPRETCVQVGDSFEEFVGSVSARLRRALVARYGVELGCEAFADALGWEWEHRDQLVAMHNPTGYLYRSRTDIRSRQCSTTTTSVAAC